jgi:hypothetical protein
VREHPLRSVAMAWSDVVASIAAGGSNRAPSGVHERPSEKENVDARYRFGDARGCVSADARFAE